MRSKVNDALAELAAAVCKDYCKYTDAANGKNLISPDDPNAMTDEEFDKFYKEHCHKCPINEFLV